MQGAGGIGSQIIDTRVCVNRNEIKTLRASIYVRSCVRAYVRARRDPPNCGPHFWAAPNPADPMHQPVTHR